MCKQYQSILRLCIACNVSYESMLKFDMNDIEAISEGLIDKREMSRSDMLTSVYHGVMIAIQNSFNGADIKDLPILKIRHNTLENINRDMLADFMGVTNMIDNDK